MTIKSRWLVDAFPESIKRMASFYYHQQFGPFVQENIWMRWKGIGNGGDPWEETGDELVISNFGLN